MRCCQDNHRAFNPLITWFSLKCQGPRCAACPSGCRPSAKPYKAFDKFVAIFNLAVGSVLLILPIVSLLDGEEFVTGMLVLLFSPCSAYFSIRFIVKAVISWMRVGRHCIFSLAVLIVSLCHYSYC